METQWLVSTLLRGAMLLAAAWWGRRDNRVQAAPIWVLATGTGLILVGTQLVWSLPSGLIPITDAVAEPLTYGVIVGVPLALVVAFLVAVRAAQMLAATLPLAPELDRPDALIVRRRLAFAGVWLLLCAPPALPLFGMLVRWSAEPPPPRVGGDLEISIAIFGALVTTVIAIVPAVVSALLAAFRVARRGRASWHRPWALGAVRGGSLAVAVAATVAVAGLALSLGLTPVMRDQLRPYVEAMRRDIRG